MVTAAAALCAARAAAQVAIAPRGAGDFLIFPYFDVAREQNPLTAGFDAQDSLIEITNPDSGRTIPAVGGGAIGAQVARIRFYQGANGAEVLDLDVVIPCGGTWTAKLEEGPDFRPRVITSSPVVTGSSATTFTTAPPAAPIPLGVTVPVSTSNQRGFIEVFAEETVRCEAAAGAGGSSSWTRLDPATTFATATRLSGEAIIVRVAAGVAESYSALALERRASALGSDWSAAGPHVTDCATTPQDCLAAVHFALRQRRSWPSFDTNPAIGASTRIVFTLPTKSEACALPHYASALPDSPFTSCAGHELVSFRTIPRGGTGASPPSTNLAFLPFATTLFRVGGPSVESLPTGGALSGTYEFDFSSSGEQVPAVTSCGGMPVAYVGKPIVVLELREYLNGAVGGTYGVSAYAPGIEDPPGSGFLPPS